VVQDEVQRVGQGHGSGLQGLIILGPYGKRKTDPAPSDHTACDGDLPTVVTNCCKSKYLAASPPSRLSLRKLPVAAHSALLTRGRALTPPVYWFVTRECNFEISYLLSHRSRNFHHASGNMQPSDY
jgi:hypothetical protein